MLCFINLQIACFPFWTAAGRSSTLFFFRNLLMFYVGIFPFSFRIREASWLITWASLLLLLLLLLFYRSISHSSRKWKVIWVGVDGLNNGDCAYIGGSKCDEIVDRFEKHVQAKCWSFVGSLEVYTDRLTVVSLSVSLCMFVYIITIWHNLCYLIHSSSIFFFLACLKRIPA